METYELTPNAFSLKGQVALITGGGTGIGLGIAQVFIAQGASVMLSGRRQAVLEEAVDQLGPQAAYRIYDVTDVDQAETMIDAVEEHFGPITALVNNAGNQVRKAAEDLTPEDMKEVWDVHVQGAFALSRHAAKRMLDKQGGSILFIASMASLMGISNVLPYAAAKSAHLGLIRTLAVEWSGRGVRVNGVAPGWIETAMSRQAFAKVPDRLDKVMARTPMQSLGQPQDIGWAAAYLASPAAKFVTGVCLPIDGGASISL
jgi:NAD(P)-dependent dehydrogenase (short-subunit alcohol dehydrogenase family)